MNSPRIVVVGSTNTDLVVSVPHLPQAGETVLGNELQVVAGGKGANQAVAAARLGGNVSFIGRVGDDDYGRQTLVNLQAEAIDTRFLQVTPGVASGVALISVHAQTGENSIVVAPGANGRVSAGDITDAREAFEAAGVVVISLEIPLDAVAAAVALGRSLDLIVILNPAPAQPLSRDLLSQLDVLTPNERELEMLGGVEQLQAAGVKQIITTLGPRGAHLRTAQHDVLVPALHVTAIDTVAAGDCFTGALAVELARGREMPDAINFAVTAASLKVTRRGAQPGMPRRDEVLRVS